jgi:manganese transport protein
VRFSYIDVIIALTIAGLVNCAMMYMSAAVFYSTGHSAVADIATAYRTLTPLLGNLAAVVFLISLMASGISSSVVGTMAGQVIMQSFVGFTVPLWVRRLITMLPAVVVVALGLNVTQTLIVSQVILSFVLPVPVIALVYLTSREKIMGPMRNGRAVTILAIAAAIAILMLNAILILTSVHPV